MMYSIRKLTEEDYPTLCEYWKFWRFPVPLQVCLPDNGTCGAMVMKDGVNIVAGFIYFTNSTMAWIEFIVSNPGVKDKKERKEAIRYLIAELCGIAKQEGYLLAYTSIKHPNLIHHYEACGFATGSKGTVEMIKILN